MYSFNILLKPSLCAGDCAFYWEGRHGRSSMGLRELTASCCVHEIKMKRKQC